MENSEPKYKFCVLDHIWYVAESWSRREHNNLSGKTLFFFCWLWIVVIPLYIPLSNHYFGLLPTAVLFPLVIFIPSLFCKLRYTPDRQEAIVRHYGKLKHPGRKLALVILIFFLLTVTSFSLMFHFNFMH